MPNNGYKKKGRRERPWSDLPTEIIELILKHCNFSDQSRLRAVCRRWQSVGRVQPLKQLPWLMAYDHRNWSRCKLFDPTYRKAYTVDMSTIKEYHQYQNFSNIRIRASKSGWLFLSHQANQSLSIVFFLYNPFDNRMIKLPNPQNVPGYGVNATFSVDPTSADCVFFVLQFSSHTVAARTCRHGDTKWTTHVFPGNFYAIGNVVYSEGLFWCANTHGRLATFSVAQGIWNVLQSPTPLDLLLASYLRGGTYLVESNGNLLLVLISHTYKPRLVFKLDRSQTPWIWVEDVGDQTLFLGPTSFSVSTALAGKSRASGKIHYRWGSKCRFLSSNCKRSYHYSKHYGLLAILEEELSEIWIEPPT